MKKLFFFLAVFLLVLAGCQSQEPVGEVTPIEAAVEPALQTYPLGEGAYWVYEGMVTAGQVGAVTEETIQWRVEVTGVVSQPSVTGYRMRGALSDLAFYTPETQPSEYAIVQVGGNRFYSADLAAYARLASEEDLLIGLVQEQNLFLELPLAPGNRFCEAEQLTRVDGSYCWTVGKPEAVTLDTPGGEAVQVYPLYYLTNPDQTLVTFAPGIGVVSFTYHHTGSISDIQMTLVEYSLGEAAP